MLRTKLPDADHLGEIRIATSANEASNLFPLGLCLELETLQLGYFALVRSSFVLDLPSERPERLCKRQHLWQITKGPLGSIGKILDSFGAGRRFPKIGEEAGTLVDVGAKHIEFLRQNQISFEKFSLDSALVHIGRTFAVG